MESCSQTQVMCEGQHVEDQQQETNDKTTNSYVRTRSRPLEVKKKHTTIDGADNHHYEETTISCCLITIVIQKKEGVYPNYRDSYQFHFQNISNRVKIKC